MMACKVRLWNLSLLLLTITHRATSGDCKGQRTVLRSAPGYVSDGPGNYSVNGNCEWLIEAPSSSYRVLLSFLFMDTECTYDYLFVYDGDSYSDRLLASLSGSSLPPTLEATSGKMLLHLFSDANYNLLGFNATYSFSLCPQGCSGHGLCQENKQCLCDAGWGGEGCQVADCRSYCNPHHGTCNKDTQRCVCSAGYVGEKCDLSLADNQGAGTWYNVSRLDSSFSPRTAAAGAFLPPTNALYIFGGLDLNDALGDLVIYNFTSNMWERRTYSHGPTARHSHVVVEWNDTLILFGGELAVGRLTGDVWVFLPLEERWMELTPHSPFHPPPLANHAAATVDHWLYVFGGRTSRDVFSSQMFRLNLYSWEWEQVLPGGGKPPSAAGHSMVFHAASRSLLIYGGHRPSTARFSMRVNTTDLFHVDLNYWTTLKPRDGSHGPRERAFHSATVIGNYMVVYGGNLHIHYQEEKCYDEEIFFYHLGCHQWVPSKVLSQMMPLHHERQSLGRGRYSHVAALMKGSVLLVAGGYSGTPRGDILAFKVPMSVYQTPVQDYHLDHCSMYADEGTCFKDPECTWCETSCQTSQRNKNCPDKSCLGLARLLSDCQACLAFSTNVTTSSHIPRSFGWCVQNETCMPLSERSTCRVGQISGTYGWWGPVTTFITSLDGCRTHNFLPGLHLITYQQPRNDSQPDRVSIVRSTTITLNPSTEMDVSLVYKGFLYPMLIPGASPERISVWARMQRFYVIARLARSSNSLTNLEEVGRWSVHQEKEHRLLQRNSGERLFPYADRGSRYAIQIEGYLNNTGNGHTSELSLAWDRTGVQGGSEISFLFLEPHRSDLCSSYPSCLACLADQGCGWCSQNRTCHQRLVGDGVEYFQDMPLILSPSNCQLCEEYRDCDACTKDSFCEWQVHSSKKGDSLCSRRGRVSSAIRNPEGCPRACNQRRTCSECLSNSSHCAWCQSTGSCFYFAAYLAKYPYGDCRDWYDSVHSVPQCMDCSRFNTCRECLQNFECGWCGNTDNPTLGRCFSGDYSGLREYSECSVALSFAGFASSTEPAQWSYASCPDVDECRLEMATCHQHATCKNTPDSYECHCDRGYMGDGVAHCNQTCYNECSHGTCSGPPSFSCLCDLGWTSDSTSVNESGVECSVDCGCHFHSTCTHGPGICDACQDWTEGAHCQECQPGSFGIATQKPGCQECACNKHGKPELGYCDRNTGVCFCTDNTQGEHCEKCAPGYYGDPRNGGTCYLECHGRQLISNVSSSALGSPGGSYCLWVLSISLYAEPCYPENTCPRLTLSLQPDFSIPCSHSYVYVFDGIPAFLDTGILQSDRSLLGAFCGRGRGVEPLTVEATTGLLVVYYETNTTEPSGFNATYTVHRCDPSCGPSHVCIGQSCVCRSPLSGPHCQRIACPRNCSAGEGKGVCNQTLGLCFCASGYAGEDCSIHLDSGKIVWENLMDPQLTADTASRFLHRLGHTMVEGPDNTLWMFGGLSLRDGILGSVYRYSISERRWTQMLAGTEGGGPGPSSRYFHAAAYNAMRNAMYVLGGLTSNGASSDFWILNLTTLQWRQEPTPLVPSVAGHTLTPRHGSSLLLIGGYSPENGFNNRVLEYNIELETWKVGHQTGTPPTGLYGHSTVYHEATDAFYVFGGQRFHVEAVTPSPELYSLYYPNLTWSLLAPSQGRKPLSHFFHVAAVLKDTMVVVGGRTEQLEYSNQVLFYQINCNSWIRPNRTDTEMGIPMNESVGHAVAVVGGRLYISGGFNGVALGRMVTLSVPSDPCMLFTTALACNQSAGSCAWCQHGCISADTAERRSCPMAFTSCFPLPRSADDCRRLKTCSECLAQHPRSMSAQLTTGLPRCKWCTNCPEGACIGSDGSCTSENDCRINQREIFLASNCSEISCEASDCHKCTASGKCMWTRQFKRTGETRRILSVLPTYDWTCFSHSLLNVSPMPVESSPPNACPIPCHNYTTCHDCLSSKGADGGWQQCVWSVALKQCMSPTFLPMRCAAGACGRVLSGTEGCSPSCSLHTHCAACIQHPRCGWCARREGNGEGVCLEGGLSGPAQAVLREQCSSPESHWAFMSCPPENECLNNHHDCNETQNCSDLPLGFQCTCKNGYILHNLTGMCHPVCEHGCVNGTCVEPNHCHCDFGYVGENCSVSCRCNKHSNCAGLGSEDKCLECHNNTMGDHCEKCKPLFVGSAVNGGTCRPCLDFCRGNSEVCMTREEHQKALSEPEKYPIDPKLIPGWVNQGPSEDTALCVHCQNNSRGDKCEECLPGYFLLDKRCTKCQCNGHADTCNELDGTNCPCSNNTESSNCQNNAQIDKRECYKHQCSKCKDSFNGNPVNGRQCYRLMTVEQEYCFDPTSQSNCFHEPNIQNLPFGRTVFFGVQPKFTNVDIRVTVDVTFGSVDVYVSTSSDSFAVDVDSLTGVHSVRVYKQIERDEQGVPEPLTASYTNGSLWYPLGKVNWIREERPRGLITYITVRNKQTVLIVRGVKDRVVITYPHELHSLKSSRFFLLLLGNSSTGSGESQGLLFFRQDQAHIDLFVFFSVFFSCFFLFLSACVLLWKVKQWLDVRREQRRHLQEMSKMASRPFAKLTVYFQPDVELLGGCHPSGPVLPPLPHHHHHHHHHHRSKPRVKSYDPSAPQPPSLRHSDPFLSQLLGYTYSSFRVGPITLEPTDDGMAGVVTLLLQLPGGAQAPNRACLGSALVTLRHNLQEYCGPSHIVSSSRKGLLSHENLTSMSI
ncbi:multiple epidermal growth factor-like domains protein 8 [Pelobates fuscus]|uniref:multiple epidermal growth factor-like domains protein 8 n=1 Tax=Pelobates fuscus TaxID=191477 RepID=UPI002FE4D900